MITLTAKFTSASRSAGAKENAHGNLVTKDGVDLSTTINVTAPAGGGVLSIDPDKFYEVSFKEIPNPSTPVAKKNA